MPFRLGECVLPRGELSPHMTVQSVAADHVMCVWFDDAWALRCSRYNPQELEAYPQPNFQPGQDISLCEVDRLVQLRSYGYFPLRVLEPIRDGQVRCSWVNRAGSIDEACFVVETLADWPESLVVNPA